MKTKGIWVVAVLGAALVACGAKKKPGDETQFKATYDSIFKNMNGNQHSLAERKKFTIDALGEPHRTEADGKLYWYTSTAVCYFYEMSPKEGYGSTGTGKKEDCEKWGVK